SGIHKSGVHNFYFSSPCAKHTQIDMILFVNDDEVLPLVVQKVLLQEDLDLKNLLNVIFEAWYGLGKNFKQLN
ncbi:hypothetical protein Csa_023641, partial [Cucumis sativus]